MKIDISKFMMITALLASAGTGLQACTVEDAGDDGTNTTAGRDGEGGDEATAGSAGADTGAAGAAGDPGTEGLAGSAGDMGTEGLGGSAGDPATEGLGGSAGDPATEGLGGSAGDPATEGLGGSAGDPATEGLGGSAGDPATEGLGGSAGDPATEGLGGSAGAAGEAGSGGAGGGEVVECIALDGADAAGETLPCQTMPLDICEPTAEGDLINPGVAACASAVQAYKSGIAEAIESCIMDASVEVDACGTEFATAAEDCLTTIPDQACASDAGTNTCISLIELGLLCEEISVERCVSHVSAAVADDADYLASCIDPSGEFYDAAFEGTCVERLDACLLLP